MVYQMILLSSYLKWPCVLCFIFFFIKCCPVLSVESVVVFFCFFHTVGKNTELKLPSYVFNNSPINIHCCKFVIQFHFRLNEFDNIVTLCTLWYLGEIKQNIHKILIKMKILQSCFRYWVSVICVVSLWHRYNGKLHVTIYINIAYRVVWKLDLRYSLAKKVNVERLVNRDQVL